ncbi:hypothetical protein FRB99_003389 [Tulasnella sp. 403]|nr:hypothetical protein FRB99_003389 [Tulasnella sp. 403]
MDLTLPHYSALSDPRAFVHPLSKILHAFNHRVDSNNLRACIIGKGAETILACLVTPLLSTRIVLVAADQRFLGFACESLAVKTTFLVPPLADTSSVQTAVFNGGLFADGLYDALGVPHGCFDVIIECSKVDTFVQMAHRLKLDNHGANAYSVLLHDSYPDDPDLRSSLEHTDLNSCADCRMTAINLLNGGLLNKIESTILELVKKDVDVSPSTTLVGSPPFLNQEPSNRCLYSVTTCETDQTVATGFSGQSHMWLSGICNDTMGLSLVPPPPSAHLWSQCMNTSNGLQTTQVPQSPPLLHGPHEDNPAAWFSLFSPQRLKAPLLISNKSSVTPHTPFDIQDPHSDTNPPRGGSLLPLEHQLFAQDQVGTGTGTSPPVSVPLSRSSTLGTMRSFSDEDHAMSPQASTITDSPVVPANPSFGRFKLTAKPSCSCPKQAQKKARHERRCPDNPNRADNDIFCDVPGCGERFTGGRKDNLKRHKLKQHGVGA